MQTTLPYTPPTARLPTPSGVQQAIVHKVAAMPMASTLEISSAIDRSLSNTTNQLRDLAQDRQVLQCTLGATLRSTPRWFLAPSLFHLFAIPTNFYNTRRGMGLLATRIYATERIYQLAQALDLLRPDHDFQWHSQRPYDAVAGSPGHWTALFWSGIWDDATIIRRKIVRLGDEVGPIWPRLLAFAVPDHWQAQLIHQVLDDLHLTHHAAVLVAADDTWHIPPPAATPRESAGWPDQPSQHQPPKLTAGHELIAYLDDQQYTGPLWPRHPENPTDRRTVARGDPDPHTLPAHTADSEFNARRGIGPHGPATTRDPQPERLLPGSERLEARRAPRPCTPPPHSRPHGPHRPRRRTQPPTQPRLGCHQDRRSFPASRRGHRRRVACR